MSVDANAAGVVDVVSKPTAGRLLKPQGSGCHSQAPCLG